MDEGQPPTTLLGPITRILISFILSILICSVFGISGHWPPVLVYCSCVLLLGFVVEPALARYLKGKR